MIYVAIYAAITLTLLTVLVWVALNIVEDIRTDRLFKEFFMEEEPVKKPRKAKK